MPITFNNTIHHLLEFEGGYCNDPDDRGGETNFGISKKAFPSVDIKGLTQEAAIDIYAALWKDYQIDKLPETLQHIVFDCAVNCGRHRAICLLQRCALETEDGILGTYTIKGAQNVTIEQYAKARYDFYHRIVARNPSQAKFLRGWLRRVGETVKQSHHLLKADNEPCS